MKSKEKLMFHEEIIDFRSIAGPQWIGVKEADNGSIPDGYAWQVVGLARHQKDGPWFAAFFDAEGMLWTSSEQKTVLVTPDRAEAEKFAKGESV